MDVPVMGPQSSQDVHGPVSLTIVGLAAAALATVAKAAGIDATEQHIVSCLATFVQIGGFIAAWIGRVRKGDVTILGIRK